MIEKGGETGMDDDVAPTLKVPRVTPEMLRALASQKQTPPAPPPAVADQPQMRQAPGAPRTPTAGRASPPAGVPPWLRDGLPEVDMTEPAEYDEIVPLARGAPKPPPAPPPPLAPTPAPPVRLPDRTPTPATPPPVRFAPPAPHVAVSETEEEAAMANVQWEYCRVQLDSGSYGQRQALGRLPYFARITVDYYGTDVPPPTVFGEDTDQIERPNKLWGQVLGLLGMANWEMINLFTGPTKDLALVNMMAYFKRPVQPGRRVNEPRLTL
jgi:hypothetical protein